MSKVNICFNFPWNTLEVFEFYKSVFWWEFTWLSKFSDIPDIAGNEKIKESEKNWVMHISLPILWGDIILMWSDSLESLWHKTIIWNHIYISLNVDTKQEADTYFQALSPGWEIEVPLEDTFWWAYYASFKDKYGIGWMINYDYPKNT